MELMPSSNCRRRRPLVGGHHDTRCSVATSSSLADWRTCTRVSSGKRTQDLTYPSSSGNPRIRTLLEGDDRLRTRSDTCRLDRAGGGVSRLRSLLAELDGQHSPRERKGYLPDFPGVVRAFGVRVVVQDDAILELPTTIEAEISKSSRPHILLAEQLVGALAALRRRQGDSTSPCCICRSDGPMRSRVVRMTTSTCTISSRQTQRPLEFPLS